MSQAEELLNSVSEEIPVHTHPVPDTDTYFVIDPITRRIENTNRKKTVIMQYDHNSERFTFELPRYIDGHDMLECNSVTVNVDNIEVVESDDDETMEPRVNSDAPDMTDLRIHPSDPEKVISSWLISRNSTQLAGILSFHIEYKCVDTNANVVYEWSTDDYDEIEIRARKKNGEAAVAAHSDLLEQWRTRIFGAGDSVMANIAAEGEAQVAAVKAESKTQQDAVELKGARTLDSIPEDYTEIDAMADEAVRSKGDAIVCEATGGSIVLKDSSNDYIRGLKLFGKSTQQTTTGKNLLRNELYSMTTNGLTITVHSDKSFTVNGTATDGVFLTLHTDFNPGAGEYILSGCPSGGGSDKYIIYMTDTESGFYAQDVGRTYKFNHPGDILPDVRLAVYKGTVMDNVVFKPMIRLASIEDDTYERYTGGKPSPNPEYPQEILSIENPTVVVCGRNLWNHDYDITNMSNISGWGTAIWQSNNVNKVLKPSTTYTMSFDVTCISVPEHETVFSDNCGFVLYSGEDGGKYVEMAMSAGDGVFTVGETRKVVGTFKTPANINDVSMKYEILRYAQRLLTSDKKPVNATIKFSNVQLEKGATTTEYVPYSGLELEVSRPIPGIPVTSGGNYTDSDGQQWICDEIDLERGVYVQRIKTVTLDGSDNEGWMLYDNNASQGTSFVYYPYDGVKYFQSSMCDKYRNVNGCWGEPYKGQLGIYSDHNGVSGRYFRPPNESVDSLETWLAWLVENPLKLMYILTTPIETPLTAEEIAAFRALRTNYPNTTILNDAGAWMSVKYNADTKSYVDALKAVKIVDSSTGVVCELKIVDGVLIIETVK